MKPEQIRRRYILDNNKNCTS